MRRTRVVITTAAFTFSMPRFCLSLIRSRWELTNSHSQKWKILCSSKKSFTIFVFHDFPRKKGLQAWISLPHQFRRLFVFSKGLKKGKLQWLLTQHLVNRFVIRNTKRKQSIRSKNSHKNKIIWESHEVFCPSVTAAGKDAEAQI